MKRLVTVSRFKGRGALIKDDGREFPVTYRLHIQQEILDAGEFGRNSEALGQYRLNGSVVSTDPSISFMPGDGFVLRLDDDRQIGIFLRDMLISNHQCPIVLKDAMDFNKFKP